MSATNSPSCTAQRAVASSLRRRPPLPSRRCEVGSGDVCVLDFAGGGPAADAPAEDAAAAHKLEGDERRLRQLLAQLEWQCSEHEALVVLEVGDDPTRVSHGWQLVSYVNTLSDDEDAQKSVPRVFVI